MACALAIGFQALFARAEPGAAFEVPLPGGQAAPQPPHAGAPRADRRRFDCLISANEVIDIGSAVSGKLEYILVERGDWVEAGQLLAGLESGAERAALRVAEARAARQVELRSSQASLELRTRQRDRARALFERATLSLDERERFETEAELAELERSRAEEDLRLAALQVEQARVALERRMITSPISGLVVERMMSRGEVVIDDQPVLRVAEIEQLRVEVILPLSLFGQVRVGDRARVVPEAPYDTPREAHVVIVDPILDGASGTFGVRLLIPNPERDLPGGLRCQVELPGSRARGSGS